MNKLLVGIGVIVVLIGVASWVYFASDSRSPVERIADDTKLQDAEALDQMARAVFNRVENATCEDVSGGIRQSIEILGSSESQIKTLSGQTAEDAAKIAKSAILMPLLFDLQEYLPLAQKRGLKELEVTAFATLLDTKAGKEIRAKIFVVSIPEDKFSAIQAIKFSMNSMSTIDKDFARAGVVKFDGFEQVVYK